MKRIISLLLVVVLALTMLSGCGSNQPAFEHTPENAVNSQAVYLLSLDTGTPVYQKNETNIVYTSTFAQTVTALVVLERCADLSAMVTVPEGLLTDYAGRTDIPLAGLAAGESYSVYDLLACVLLEGDYDAIDVLATYIAGTVDSFVDMMNAKVKALGASSTRFLNPNGAHDDSQYTTARDVALVTKSCLTLSDYTTLSAMPSYTIPATETQEEILLINHNLLVQEDVANPYYTAGCIPLFAGFTRQAGDCAATYRTQNGMQYLLVVMNAPVPESNFPMVSAPSDDTAEEEGDTEEPEEPAVLTPAEELAQLYGLARPALEDTDSLLEWAFATTKVLSVPEDTNVLTEIPVVGNFAQTTLQLKLRKNITSYLPKNVEPDNVLLLVRTPRQIAELTEKNAPIGAMDVINGSEVITAAVPLVAAHDITEQETGGSGFGKVLLWIFIIILLLAAALFVIRTINIYRYRKRRARRAAAQRAKARQQAAAQRRQ